MTVSKFKVGNRVYAPFKGYGTITQIREGNVYPIIVKWDDSETQYSEAWSSFTEDGDLIVFKKLDELRITVVEDKEEKVMANDEKFKVGDHVWSLYWGIGVVERISDATNTQYPVAVRWTEDARCPNTLDYFTKDGEGDFSDNTERDISPLEVIDLSKGDTGVVDRMMDALDKKTDDAINPSHYKVKGLPEAHEIMNHLMHREQLEGFYWGNIIKYAYRYDRKGDKAETAGKIAWYATKLKELEECESK